MRYLTLTLLVFFSLTPNPIFASSWLEQTLIGHGTGGPYLLGVVNLIEGTETITVNGVVVRSEKEYHFDGRDGIVTFTDTISTGAAMTIRVMRVPMLLQEEYRRRRVEASAVPSEGTGSTTVSSDVHIASSKILNDTLQSFSPLVVKGSKTLGVRLGSDRNLSLDQTLSLTVSGRLGHDLDVTAVLSDRHLPIQPEGNTRTITELDKVLMQIRSERLGVSLGDLNFTLNETIFGDYNRRLKGLQGEVNLPGDDGHLTIVGASSEGTFTTGVIHPIEGSQGPYQLTSENGDENIVVIAGTERIWINGILMARGETDDYTIDYGRGQVFFTGRRLITAESYIIAEYEYTDRRFQRQVAALAGRSALMDGKVTLGLTAIRESDVPDRAISFDLSNDDRTILRNAGDDERSAWKNQDTSGLTRPLSDRSTFSWTGGGNGDYRYIGGGRYEYVGAGEGSYMPGIQLPLPERHQLMTFDITATPLRRLTLSAEGAISDLDRNLLSPKDDHDNAGRAYTIRTSFIPEDEGRRGITFSGSHRFVGGRFRPFGRRYGVEEHQGGGSARWTDGLGHWGLGFFDNLGEESSTEITMGYTLNRFSGISIGFGQSRRGESFLSTRREVAASLGRTGWPLTTYQIEQITMVGAGLSDRGKDSQIITRQRGTIGHTIAGIRPEIRVEAEHGGGVDGGRSPVDGRGGSQLSTPAAGNYLDISGSVFPVGEKRLTWTSTWGLRREWRGIPDRSILSPQDEMPSEFPASPLSIAVTQSHQVSFRAGGGTVLTGEYARRDRRSGPKSATARIGADFSPFEGIVTGKARYEFSNLRAAKKWKTFIDVGTGKGNYRWEDRNGDGRQDVEEYLWDPDGDYILYIEEIGDYRPAIEATAGISFTVDPGIRSSRWQAGWWKLFSYLSSETSIDLGCRTGRGSGLFFLVPLQLRIDDMTIEGRRSIDQTIDLFRNGRPYSFRFRYRLNDDLDLVDIDRTHLQISVERSIRGRYRPGRELETEIEFASGSRKRTGQRGGSVLWSDGTGRIFDFDIQSRTGTSRIVHRPSAGSDIRLTTIGAFERDERPLPVTHVRWFSFAPEIARSFSNRGRLRLRGEWVNVDVRPKGTPLVFQFARGRREGQTLEWTGSLDYRVGDRTTATCSYTGRRYPQLPTTHLGQAEVRAYF